MKNYLFLLLFFTQSCFSTMLVWDASPSTNVGGYNLATGMSSGNYSYNIDVGNVTTYDITTVSGQYFAVKAYDTTNTIESVYSNEVNIVPDFTYTLQDTLATYTPITVGNVVDYLWELPGSSSPTSAAQIAVVNYPTAGTYNAKLTINGNAFIEKQIAITPAYTANFSVNSDGLTVNFTDTSTGAIASRLWDFGDGNTSTLINPTNTYSTAGSYTTSLTVNGDSIKTTTITVSVPVSGLVAEYNFEESSGTAIIDTSGQGNHGITNASRITTGKYGQALSFDGIDDWVTISDSASLDLTTGMTLKAWVYPTVTPNPWACIVMKEQTGQQVYTITANSSSGSPATIQWIDGEQVLTGGLPLITNKWSHLATTYDGQNMRLYVDGIQVAAKPQLGSLITSTGDLRIGGNSIWGEYFQGYIDEVQIYNKALTAAELVIDPVIPPLAYIMGNTIVEATPYYQPKGRAQAFKVTPSISGSIVEVAVYLNASTTTTTLVAGIYTNSGNHAGTLISQGTLNTVVPGGWNFVPIPTAAITADTPYWFAILGTTGGIRLQTGAGSGIIEKSSSKTLTKLPITWKASTSGYTTNTIMSIYGNGN